MDPLQPGDRWDGRVCFGDGWFHPVPVDAHGDELGPDLETKLVHVTDDGAPYFRAATADDVDHFDTHGRNEVVLEVAE